jgi:hypothetical protein
MDFMSDFPGGPWLLRIEDTVANGQAGTLLNWSLDIETGTP